MSYLCIKGYLFLVFQATNSVYYKGRSAVKQKQKKVLVIFLQSNINISMVDFKLFQSKFRSRFKQKITAQRSFTQGVLAINPSTQSLAEISQKAVSEQKDKKIHNMTKQSFITTKKHFLLKRKIPNKAKTQEIDQIPKQMNNQKTQRLVLMGLSDQKIQKDEVFHIERQIMKDPLNFHRNMLIRMKNDEQTKNILRKWYKQNVSLNQEKLRSFSEMGRSQSTSTYGSNQANKDTNQKNLKIFNRRKMSLFTNEKLRSFKTNVNESNLQNSRYKSQEQKLTKSQNTQKLQKLVIRVQPFWQKARMKVSSNV